MIGITFLLLFSQKGTAQIIDSTTTVRIDKIRADTIPLMKITKHHSPKKAAILSAVLPGAGQIYNKKYWKVPLIYAGAAGLVYSLNFNQSRYIKYRTAYKYRIDNDASTTDDFVGVYSDENLNTLQKYYHRYRDLTIIGFAVVYALNIVDASVDAHLFTFDVSDNLSMKVQPSLINTAGSNRYSTGIGLSIHF